MKKTLSAILLVVASATVVAAEYKIDSNHTNARFAIDHFGTTTNTGGFYGLTGQLQFDPDHKTGSIDLTIPVKNLMTGNAQFDAHLKNADLFNAEKYPQMRFQSTKWHFKGNKVSQVDGTLTLLGQTHPVKLKATKFNCYQSPVLNAEACGGDFKTTIDRTQWGMDFLVAAGMSKKVDLTIQIEATKN